MLACVTQKGYTGNKSVTFAPQPAAVKTISIVQVLRTGIKPSLGVGAAILLLTSGSPTRAASPAELFERGIYTEETKGDLKAASDLYRRIVDDPSASRSLVAQAQLRRGLCELKLGHKPQAISALERLTQEFPDKDKLLALVEEHMPQLLDEMLQRIEHNYIEEVDRSELLETALRAIVGKLDARGPFLRTNDMEFLGANEVAQMNEALGQRIAGVGAVLKVDETTREIVVATPMPGSPAFKGGLRSGDRIIEVDGSQVPNLATAVRRLRGPVGTPVRLGLKRGESDELLDLELVRDTIRIPSVSGDQPRADGTWEFLLDEQRRIGYVRLSQFGNQSPAEMQAALDELAGRGMKALILDLRDNPGGSLAESVAVADLFVKEGRILTVKGRSGETVYDAKLEGTFSNFPMAVLVNRNTASAAEIVAGCLQDHQRAVIVGERTFGQGIVRSLFPLNGGLGALKLPVAAYYRPSGKSVNRYPFSKDSDDWGIKPDEGYEVAFTEDELKEYQKARSERAILNPAPDPRTTRFNDRQLQKAVDWVTSQVTK
jgi:carboxyl-terminal processing protease